MLTRFLYSAIWIILLPLALMRLAWRARKQPAYLKYLTERLAWYTSANHPSSTIWIHAVSVGETRAAEPLIRALLSQCPSYRILLTHMTPTGRETAAALFANEQRIQQVYLPYDLSFFVTRFLDHFSPKLGIIMETELWPNLLAACHVRCIPTLLANARLSARSAKRYGHWPALTHMTLNQISCIGAQTITDAERFQALGAQNISITGNIKFDICPPESRKTLAQHFRLRIGQRPVVLVASTRDGEENELLDAFCALPPDNVLLVIVPRHPQRFNDVAALIAAHGLQMQRRSDHQAVEAATRVWLGDSMGEMFAYYSLADVALIGGGWAPLGGQNPIEACAIGTPAIVGPHMFNFEHITQQALKAGALIQEETLHDGLNTAFSLLKKEHIREEMVASGYRFIQAHQGATARTLALINRLADSHKNHSA